MFLPSSQIWQQHEDKLLFSGPLDPDWSEDPAWVNKVLGTSEIRHTAYEQGADRIQCRLVWQDTVYLLFFEILCDAVWIEAESVSDTPELVSLSEFLNRHTQQAN